MILFDGVCHLCNGFVRFVLARDRGRFAFAPLQSEYARRTLGGRSADSVVLIEQGGVFEAEDAALRIARRLRQPWPLVAALLQWLPRRLLAAAYRSIARHRYSWFGREEVCPLPPPEWPPESKDRFLVS